jgi:predicted phage-related endonuclease
MFVSLLSEKQAEVDSLRKQLASLNESFEHLEREKKETNNELKHYTKQKKTSSFTNFDDIPTRDFSVPSPFIIIMNK